MGGTPPVPPGRSSGRRTSSRVRAPLPPLPRGINDETWEEKGKFYNLKVRLKFSWGGVGVQNR